MTRAQRYPKTIQTWKGDTYAYRGEPDGASNQRSLRRVPGAGESAEAWRKGTPDEWRQIRIELRAQGLVAREILCQESSLVNALLEAVNEDQIKSADLLTSFVFTRIDNSFNGEAAQWWRVSRWLCDELRKIGETVLDNDYGSWWGRRTGGQDILMDGTLQQIAAQFERGE